MLRSASTIALLVVGLGTMFVQASAQTASPSTAPNRSAAPSGSGSPTSGAPGTVATAPAGPVTTGTFATMVAGSNLFEIQSSQLALSRSQSAQVKDFANRMITDHNNAAAKLKKALAQARLSAPPDKLDAKHQTMLNNLTNADSATFDKTYINAQYLSHVEAVNLFESYSKSGDNAQLKAFAADLLPTLRGHLDHVSKLR